MWLSHIGGIFLELDFWKVTKSTGFLLPTLKYPISAVYTILSYFYKDKSKPSSNKKALGRYEP
jgi:hypothetical protein